MSFRSTLQNWEYLAKKDPLWAILSDPKKKDGRWDLDEFLASGQAEIDSQLRFLERRGALPIDFASVVDFGCGVGRLSRALAGRFERATGVDAAPTMIERARALNADRANLELVLNQEPHLGRFADGSVSFVYSALVLQHITYPESLAYVREFFRILKPGGVAMFQTPTRDRTPRLLRLVRDAVRAIVRRAGLPFDQLYVDMNTIPAEEIERAAAQHGCEIVARFDLDRHTVDAAGELVAVRAPRFARIVSEQFVVRKRG